MFFVHNSQMSLYCDQSEQQMELVYLPYSSQPDEQQEQQSPWEKNVSQPLLDFLSNLNDRQMYADVQDEMLIDLSPSENNDEIIENEENDNATYLDYPTLNKMTY